MSGIVLATGGGAVLRAPSRARLKENGTVLYLHAEPETLWQRLRNSNIGRCCRPPTRATVSSSSTSCAIRCTAKSATHVIESDRDAVIRFVALARSGAMRGVLHMRTLDVGLGDARLSDPHRPRRCSRVRAGCCSRVRRAAR